MPEALIQLTVLGGIGLVARAVMRHNNLVLCHPSYSVHRKTASEVPKDACMSISSHGQELRNNCFTGSSTPDQLT